MASLRKAKKQAKKEGRVFIDPTKEKKQLLRSVNEQVRETNKRLRQLDKKGFYGSFSSRKLFDRLGGGKINALEKVNGKVVGVKVNKKMNVTELTAINKATKNFLRSETSTPYKIGKVVKNTKKAMLKTLKTKNDDLTMEDIEFYYSMLGDSDFDYFADKIGSSDLWAIIDDAVDRGDSEEQFIARLGRYISTNDADVKKKAINLFNKYVR